MPIVDAHVHLYPDELNRDPAGWAVAHGETHWAMLATRRRRASGEGVQEFPSLRTLLQAMDDAGVDRAVLQGWYWEHPETCAWQNRFYAQCVRQHPDRLEAFATFHPGAGEAAVLAELRRARDEGLAGLGELSPHSQDVPVTHPALVAALGLAGDRGWPVCVHVTDPLSRPYPGRIVTPREDVATLARGFPETRFLLAHWGGGFQVRGYPNVWVDTAAAPLIYGSDAWLMSGRTCRPEQVVFGSDFPLRLRTGRSAVEGWRAFVTEAPVAVREAEGNWKALRRR
ncbi:MAG: amidohydrolase family protein [Opitutaceae bacterium]|jgi:predicted TIM-barrel fold metal-dependent hydrolase|nr:amidohydrolase family protein [Opitutaceae bacterium]